MKQDAGQYDDADDSRLKHQAAYKSCLAICSDPVKPSFGEQSRVAIATSSPPA
jgi:hypothetical protein